MTQACCPIVPFVGAGRLLTYRLSALDAETLGDTGLLPDRAVRRRGRLLTYRLSALDAETLGDTGLLPDRAVRPSSDAGRSRVNPALSRPQR